MGLATPLRTSVDPLIEGVQRDAPLGDFFDQVLLLERGQPEASRVGTAQPVGAEAVRFRSSIRLSLPPRDIEMIAWERTPTGVRRCRMTVTFLGLTGVVSPLPPEYCREIIEDSNSEREETVRGFLDLFHHRAISLYYRAWAKYRPVLFEDPQARMEPTRLVLALGGIDVDLTRGREPQAETALRSLLSLVGPLSNRVRSAASVEACVSKLLGGVDVEVRAWLPRRVQIPADQLCRLGAASSSLGRDLMVGETVSDRSGRCGVRIGPLRLALFRALVPDTPNWEELCRVLDLCLPPALEYQITTILDPEDVPPTILGGSSSLGRSSWLGPPRREDLEVSFSPEEVYGHQVAGAQ